MSLERKKRIAKLEYIISMFIVGSIGIIVKNIPLASSQIALLRGVIGFIFVFIFGMIVKNKVSFKRIRKDIKSLLVSGIALGANWMMLFEAYKYTSITNATISYYFAPVIVVLFTPIVLKVKMNPRKIVGIIIAAIGMILVVGAAAVGKKDIVGIGFGLCAAIFYAIIIFMNQFLKEVTGIERSLVQLFLSAITLLPYVAMTEGVLTGFNVLKEEHFIYILVIGIIYTGIVYLLYFSSMKYLSSHTVAVYSYIDPVFAIIISAVVLQEGITVVQLAGGALILASTYLVDD